MRVAIYIVTYKKNDVLNNCLKSLRESIDKRRKDEIFITILANHPETWILGLT